MRRHLRRPKRLADFVRAFDSPDSHPAPRALSVPAILTARVAETDAEAAVCMWAQLDGISVVVGKALTRAFTVAELASQTVTHDQIRALKTESQQGGRREPHRHSRGLARTRRPARFRPAVARLLLDTTGGLSRLCVCTDLAAVKLPQKTRSVQLGKARAEKVQRILCHKERNDY